QEFDVLGDDFSRSAGAPDVALVDPDDVIAQGLDLIERMRAEEDRLARLLEGHDAIEGLARENPITDRQRLVDDEYVGIDVRGDGEGQAHEHATRIGLDRVADEFRSEEHTSELQSRENLV